MYQVFVFGTLKEGFPNYKYNKGTRVSGEYQTKERFPLYLVGKRYVPWMVDMPCEGFNVHGQIFTVDHDAMAEMDKLECISEPDDYFKAQITVVSRDTNQEFLVYAYIKPQAHLESADIKLGPLKAYEAEHSKLYRPRNPCPSFQRM